MSHPALFLDRDGVLNIDRGYVGQIANFEPVKGVFDALRCAEERGYRLIVVTNQSGIGRGYFTQDDYDALERHMRQMFAAKGVTFTSIRHCPHLPDANCACRKPKPGMIIDAAREHGIDLQRSLLIGDKSSDAEAGRAAGVGWIELIAPNSGIDEIVARMPNASAYAKPQADGVSMRTSLARATLRYQQPNDMPLHRNKP